MRCRTMPWAHCTACSNPIDALLHLTPPTGAAPKSTEESSNPFEVSSDAEHPSIAPAQSKPTPANTLSWRLLSHIVSRYDALFARTSVPRPGVAPRGSQFRAAGAQSGRERACVSIVQGGAVGALSLQMMEKSLTRTYWLRKGMVL